MTPRTCKNSSVTLSLAAALLCSTATFTATLAAAQSGAESFELGTLVLRNQEDATGPVDGDGNPPTVTGTKAPVTLNQVPQSVSVLGREDIERFGSSTVSEALRYTAGVTTEVFGNDQDYDWLRIRGFQADQTGIYLDNAQNLSYAFGSFFIDPYTLERVEVLRGPSSALYGGSNPGGIVNYVSKRPAERVRELTFGVNDASGAWVEFDYGDSLGADRAYRLTGRIEGGDKYDSFNHGLRGTFAPSFKFTTDGGTEITLLANLHAADEQHNGSTFLPYYGTVSPTTEFGYIDPDANFSDSDWDDYRRRQASVSGIVEKELANGFTITGIARLGVASVEERYFYPFGYAGFSETPVDATGTLALIGFEHDTLVRTAQTDLRYYGTVETGAVSHDLLMGLDARFYSLGETQASNFSDTNSVVNPVNPGTPVLNAPYIAGGTFQRQVGLYFQDQMRWGDGWIGTVNLRHDFVSTTQDFNGGFDRKDNETSYRVALAREFANEFTPYVTYSTFFNPLIASPASGVTKPESGEQFEVGFKWAPTDANFSMSASAFQIDRDNVVTGAFPAFSQLGSVRSRGVEFEGKYDFNNGFTLQGAATFIDAKVTEDTNTALIGTTPTLIPESQLSLLGSYAFQGDLSGLTLGAGVRYTGESFADAANTLVVPDATLVDFYATYEIRKGLEANFAVTNIADKDYVTGCQTSFVCSYGSGREISLSLAARW
ncbi:TonB-dependent siderophore receptor [Roseobacter sp. N2S]|uniref:TonB-dependent siderophore receptor n=1 Tax=Roseobacter sp. N2S TaxID=2663844 RepID=UPI00285F17FB|nr:TonB-dependent siderophore receptor [Roseobacter sp. N2S]MDR6265623.1 iron complex outermembrane receptor protein [Roseobacter sp. N2S]